MGLKENSGVDISLIAADFVFVLREGIGRDASEAPRQMLGEGLLDLRGFCPRFGYAGRPGMAKSLQFEPTSHLA